MITKEDLEKKYLKLSNRELLDILDNKHQYTELAVIVALKELSKRNIDEKEIKSYKENQVKEAEIFIKKNIVDDLNFFQKNIFFFLWLPFINFLFKRSFIDDGYILKLKQANYYSWFGFISCILSSIIKTRFETSELFFWGIWIFSFPIAFYYDEYFNRYNQIKKLRKIFGEPEENEKENS